MLAICPQSMHGSSLGSRPRLRNRDRVLGYGTVVEDPSDKAPSRPTGWLGGRGSQSPPRAGLVVEPAFAVRAAFRARHTPRCVLRRTSHPGLWGAPPKGLMN